MHVFMKMGAAAMLLPTITFAGELPVMDSIPRWDEGVGFEIYHERYGSDKLLHGSDEIANPLGLKQSIKETWFQAIYYPVKEYGLYTKLPYIDHYKDENIGGVKHRQSDSGFGDAEVGAVLRHFWNNSGSTADIAFVPQLRFPTGRTTGELPLGDGSIDAGFKLNGKWEDYTHMLMTGVDYWHNSQGSRGMDQGDEWKAHLMYGYHVYLLPEYQFGFFLLPNIEAMWEDSGRDLDGKTGGLLVHGGPAIKFYKANYLLYLGADFPIYERVSGTHLSDGNHYHFSIGTAF